MEKKPKKKPTLSKRLIKGILLGAGTFFLGLGVLGVLLPILPTTPFLLLAVACYARSSKKFYDRLINNKWFGTYIKNYREGKGVNVIVKLYTILVLWSTILISVFCIIQILWVRILLMIIAVGVTTHILTIKTYKKE